MRPRICLFTLLHTCLSTFSLAQGDSSFLARVSRSLAGYANANPVEKVYLHLDRSSYYPGDTIWFKAYIFAGDHRLSDLSGVLYCELINDRDSVVVRHILKIAAGISWGDFSISRKYSPGNYHIRAYTNWMRNAGTEYFFNQRIRLLGPQPNSVLQKNPAAAKKSDVQFFPEGGDLVNGLRSRVAVKCVNANGLGEDVSGAIIDNDGAEVASFTTQHLGMGVFALTPVPGKTYQARITGNDSTQFTVSLPAAADKGYTLTVNNSSMDSIYVKVAANDKQFAGSQNAMFYLMAQCAGRVYYTAQAKLTAPVFTASIAKNRFPSGIVQFTLFSQSGEPLNERIIFVQNNDGLNIKLSSDSANYTTRQKVKISLDTKSDTGKVPISSLSVSVINESRLLPDENAESTILNNLLLTSDLKGYIEQPNYYFTGVNDQKRANLDLLMLTQGYRRFEWKQILNTTIKQYNIPAAIGTAIQYQPETDLQIEGTLKTPSGKPLPKGKITLAATRDGLVTDTVTDANGVFRFTGLNLSDTAKIILRARKANNGSNVNIYVKQKDYPAVIKNNSADETAAPLKPEMLRNIAEYTALQKLDSIKNGRLLKEVVINGKKQAKPDVYNRYGTRLEHSIDMKQLQGYLSLDLALNAQPILINRIEIIKRGVSYYQDKIDSIPVLLDGLFAYKTDLRALKPEEVESVSMLDGFGLIVNTKRYAGTDTASTKLKEVTIRANRIAKPDTYNNYGTVPEFDVDMKRLNQEYITVKDGVTIMVPGLYYTYDRSIPVLRYEDTTRVRLIVDGLQRSQADIDTYSLKEIDNIRLIHPTLLDPFPVLIITSKNYAGTDTTSAVQLKTVTINAKKEKAKPDLSASSNRNGPGNANQVIMGDNLSDGCINLSDCLTGRLAGVLFKGSVPYLMRAQNKLGGAPAMSVIIDGMIMDGTHLNDVSATDVYSIEVLRSGAYLAIYGSGAPGGAIVITTRRGSSDKFITSAAPAGLITYPFQGYHKARVFYSPKYDHPKTGDEPSDFRSTIYWNPNIITDKDGKASFEFYNNDTKGTYRVVVEGIDDEGKLGRAIYRYTVN